MEYYSVIKKNEVLIHIIKWMKLGIVMVSKRSQT